MSEEICAKEALENLTIYYDEPEDHKCIRESWSVLKKLVEAQNSQQQTQLSISQHYDNWCSSLDEVQNVYMAWKFMKYVEKQQAC
jgi:hypothetical protein